jgi:lipopolysaccharide export system ATP-binding protein
VASGGELKSLARWPPNLVSSCSTNPFAGVDPIAVLDIQKIIRFLKERGIGVLITDHNVRETLGICDHAYIINEGSVLAAGRPDEIIYNENVRKVYLGENFRL